MEDSQNMPGASLFPLCSSYTVQGLSSLEFFDTESEYGSSPFLPYLLQISVDLSTCPFQGKASGEVAGHKMARLYLKERRFGHRTNLLGSGTASVETAS